MFEEAEICAEYELELLPGGEHCAALRGAFDLGDRVSPPVPPPADSAGRYELALDRPVSLDSMADRRFPLEQIGRISPTLWQQYLRLPRSRPK